MIVAVQAISKILADKDFSFVTDNALDESYFTGYEQQFKFIQQHYEKYGNVPDAVTFLSKFPDFNLTEVTETNEYLLADLQENHLYLKSVEAIQTAADLLKEDSNKAVEYLRSRIDTDLRPQYEVPDESITDTANERVTQSELVGRDMDAAYIPTGFDEIDADMYGLRRGEELMSIVARTNHGKTWILEAICTHAVEHGERVGFFSPEMSSRLIGYRFDTLHGHISNSAITFGKFSEEFSLKDYSDYAVNVSELEGKMYVTNPKSFQRKTTVSKLRSWAIKRNLTMLALDGITYLTDERYKRGDSKTISLTNICEDLMELSIELKIPVLLVVQANRGGVVDKSSLDTPELENIRDSDGIAMNSSIVFSLRQLKDHNDNTCLIIENKKMRNGTVGKVYKYQWDINTGTFNNIADIELPKRPDESDDTMPTGSGHKRKQIESEDEF